MTQSDTLDSLTYQLDHNANYWTDRIQKLEDSLDKNIQANLDNLKRQYQDSLKQIDKILKNFYTQFADLENVSYREAQRILDKDELAAFHMSLEEYTALGRKQAITFDPAVFKIMQEASLKVRISHYEALRLQIMGELAKLASAEQLNMYASLARTYEDRYYKTLYTIDNGTGGVLGVSFDMLNDRQILKASQRPWAADGVEFSHRIWNNQKKLKENLDKVITQGIMTGEGYMKQAKKIEAAMGTTFNNAVRIVETEHAAIASQAQQDAFDYLGVEKYRIVATLDTVTSQICQKLDGQILDMKDYKVGVTAPPFHPNCRTTTSPAIDGSDIKSRMARLENKEGKEKSTVIEYMTYEEWAKKYNIKPKYGRVNPNSRVELVEEDGVKRLKIINTDQSTS